MATQLPTTLEGLKSKHTEAASKWLCIKGMRECCDHSVLKIDFRLIPAMVSLFFFFFLNHYHIISAFFCKHQHEEEVPSK